MPGEELAEEIDATALSSATSAAPGNHRSLPPHRNRRRWLVAGIVTILLAMTIGSLLALFIMREDPKAKSLNEAVNEFRETQPPILEAPAARQPVPGVYVATGEGSENLSFPPLSQHDGTTMPVTVVHTVGGCWALAIDYNDAHRQTWDYCVSDDAETIVERGGQTFQRWDLGATTISNTSTFMCDPPVIASAVSDAVGSATEQVCEGTNSQVSGATTSAGRQSLVRDEPLAIEGVDVQTHHYRRTREITGTQIGEEQTEMWIETSTGLPMRMERTIRIQTDSPVGNITYTEAGWWQLQSRTPNA
jgi:hypothetical protein